MMNFSNYIKFHLAKLAAEFGIVLIILVISAIIMIVQEVRNGNYRKNSRRNK